MRILSVFAALCLLPEFAASRELAPQEADLLEERFFAAQRRNHSVQSAFTQTVSAPGLPAPVVSEGRLFYRAPDSLRIDYTRPPGDFLQLQGDRFTSRRAGGQTMTRGADHPSARALAALREVLRGRLPEDTMTRRVFQEPDCFRVRLTPEAGGPDSPGRIENVIDARTLHLRSLSVLLPRGVLMTFEFSKFRTVRPVPPDIFSHP